MKLTPNASAAVQIQPYAIERTLGLVPSHLRRTVARIIVVVVVVVVTTAKQQPTLDNDK
jgi:hypothetical protein